MLRSTAILSLIVAAVIAMASFAAATSHADERSECPGKILCPITDDLVCRDRCPLGSKTIAEKTPVCCSSDVDASRPDCPGRIVCPLTGQLVCTDRCPLDTEQVKDESAVPSCCQNRD